MRSCLESLISELPSLYLIAHPKNLLFPNFLSAPIVNPLVLTSFALTVPSCPKLLKDISARLQLDHLDFLSFDLCLLIKVATLFLTDGSNLFANVCIKGSW